MQQSDTLQQKSDAITVDSNLGVEEVPVTAVDTEIQDSSTLEVPQNQKESSPVNTAVSQKKKPLPNYNTSLIAPAANLSTSKNLIQAESDTSTIELQLPPPVMRTKPTTFWEIPVLLICILTVALVRAFNQRRFTLLTKSIFNIRVVPQYLREENAFSNQVISVLSFCFVIISSLLILQLVRLWYPTSALKPFQLFSRLCFFIILVYIIKFAVLELLSEIFDVEPIIREYVYNVLLFNSLIGVCLIPIVLTNNLLLEHKAIFAIAGIVVVGVIYALRNWRAISLGRMHKYPVYYIFLYLCTLEILPGLILVKLLKQQLI